jgi:hypothetical protein
MAAPARSGSDLAAQAYYDRTRRVEPGFEETRNTVDLDLQYSRQAGRHALLAGGGYRFSRGVAVGVPTIVFTPAARTDDIFSAFVQDRFEASPDRLLVTLGVKVERNDYSGLEVQPSARVWFGLRPHQSVWAAVSRAVRTPSRVERDLDLTIATDPARPLFTRLVRSDAFTSENAIVYEAGYRAQRGQRFLFDASLFQNEYANLLSVEPGGAPFAETDGSGTRTIVPFLFGNGIRGRVRGVELAADVRITDAWRVHASYSFLDMDLEAQPDSLDTTTAASTEGSSPRHRGLVRSSLTLGDVQLDAIWRRVSSLPRAGHARVLIPQRARGLAAVGAARDRDRGTRPAAEPPRGVRRRHRGRAIDLRRGRMALLSARALAAAALLLGTSLAHAQPEPTRPRPLPPNSRSRPPSSTTSRASWNGRRRRGTTRARRSSSPSWVTTPSAPSSTRRWQERPWAGARSRSAASPVRTRPATRRSCSCRLPSARTRPRYSRRSSARGILTVGDTDGFASQGGAINFTLQARRVRFEINPTAAEQARLKMSSQLLKLATLVPGPRP